MNDFRIGNFILHTSNGAGLEFFIPLESVPEVTRDRETESIPIADVMGVSLLPWRFYPVLAELSSKFHCDAYILYVIL